MLITVLAYIIPVARVNFPIFLFVQISCGLKGEERCSVTPQSLLVKKLKHVRELNFELINLNLIMYNNYVIDSICYVMCVMCMCRIISQNLRKGHVTVEVPPRQPSSIELEKDSKPTEGEWSQPNRTPFWLRRYERSYPTTPAKAYRGRCGRKVLTK